MTTTQTGTGPTVRLIDRDSAEAHSAGLVKANIGRLQAMFPDAFTEGRIDFEVLKSLLGAEVDEREEKYGLNWHGKRRARQVALTPSTGTLRPCREESVDWDTTQNLMIEGDNLEVLKLLQKSYAGKVKLIYIDPPYNTGKDFVYPDKFQDSIKNYLELTGQVESGQKISSNTDASGRFHTDWLNMVYPRLKLARGLIQDDGVILVSIDDREHANLRTICNDIFGEENFIGAIVWKGATDNNPTQVATEHEYILCYGRSKDAVEAIWKNRSEDAKQVLMDEYKRLKSLLGDRLDDIQRELRAFIRTHREALAAVTHYDRIDGDGVYTGSRKVHNPKPGGYKYDVQHPVTKRACVRPVNGYRYPEPRMTELVAGNRILFGEDETQIVQIKEYLDDYEGKLSSVIHLDSRTGSNELNSMFGVQKLFSNPKPVALLKTVFEFIAKPGDLVLDFFAGSGSSAQAVLELNLIDSGARRFVLVQLPEPLDDADKDQRVGAVFCDSIGKPRTIAELTKERLRRAASKIRQEVPAVAGDVGFRVFKLDASNIRAWNPNPEDLQTTVEEHTEHLLHGRSEQDVLYELLLKLGLDLAVPIETRQIAGKTVHNIGAGALMVCLSDGIDRDVAEPLALGIAQWQKAQAEALQAGGDDKNKPVGTKLVFKDSAFADDVAKTNLAAILSQHGLDDVRSI